MFTEKTLKGVSDALSIMILSFDDNLIKQIVVLTLLEQPYIEMRKRKKEI